MTLKIALIVLLSATLTLADTKHGNEYKEMMKKENAEAVYTFMYDKDKVKVRRSWRLLLARVLLSVQNAKEEAVQAAGNGEELVATSKKEWTKVADSSMKDLNELARSLTDLIENYVPTKTSTKWKKFTEEGIKLWENFDETVERGDLKEVRKFMTYASEFFQKYYTTIKQKTQE